MGKFSFFRDHKFVAVSCLLSFPSFSSSCFMPPSPTKEEEEEERGECYPSFPFPNREEKKTRHFRHRLKQKEEENGNNFCFFFSSPYLFSPFEAVKRLQKVGFVVEHGFREHFHEFPGRSREQKREYNLTPKYLSFSIPSK